MEAGPETCVSLRNSVSAANKGGYVFRYGAPALIVTANREGYGCGGLPVRSELKRTGDPVTWIE